MLFKFEVQQGQEPFLFLCKLLWARHIVSSVLVLFWSRRQQWRLSSSLKLAKIKVQDAASCWIKIGDVVSQILKVPLLPPFFWWKKLCATSDTELKAGCNWPQQIWYLVAVGLFSYVGSQNFHVKSYYIYIYRRSIKILLWLSSWLTRNTLHCPVVTWLRSCNMCPKILTKIDRFIIIKMRKTEINYDLSIN